MMLFKQLLSNMVFPFTYFSITIKKKSFALCKDSAILPISYKMPSALWVIPYAILFGHEPAAMHCGTLRALDIKLH